MKIISALLLTTSLYLNTFGGIPSRKNTKLTTKVEHSDINDDGINDLTTKTTFRGKDRILVEVDRKKISKPNFRVYFCKGAQPLREEDHDYDGVYEKLYFNGTKYDDYEIFIRSTENKVTALKSKEYEKELTKTRKEIENSIEEFKKAKEALFKSMRELDAVSGSKQKSLELLKELQETLEQRPDNIKFLLKDLEPQKNSKKEVD